MPLEDISMTYVLQYQYADGLNGWSSWKDKFESTRMGEVRYEHAVITQSYTGHNYRIIERIERELYTCSGMNGDKCENVGNQMEDSDQLTKQGGLFRRS